MKITRTAELPLTTEPTSARDLKALLDHVPDDAHIAVNVEHIPADRPWESARTNVTVFAEWVTEL